MPLAVNKTASIFLPSVDGSTLTSDIDPTAATPSLALTSSGGVSVYGDISAYKKIVKLTEGAGGIELTTQVAVVCASTG